MHLNKRFSSITGLVNTNIIFLIMIFASAGMTLLFFKSWNPSPKDISFLKEPALEKFSIDTCAFGAKDITVIGWAYVENNPKILNKVYAQLDDYQWVELMSSTVNRGDVVSAFHLPSEYARSGFKSSRRNNSSSENFTKKIMITSIDRKGIAHAAKYNCK